MVVSHIAPDGDAIGSLLGLAHAMRARGKTVTAAIDDGVPSALRFVPGSETVVSTVSDGEFHLMIAVDSSDISRIGEAGAYGLEHSRRAINLDHHPTNTRYGDIHLIVPEAVAAVEIVYDFLAFMGYEISQDVAIALLTGLVTDTQGFRISATNSRTLEIAQDLMQRGASLSQIMANTLNSRPYQEVELWKQVLPSVKLERGLIWATIRQCDIDRVGSAWKRSLTAVWSAISSMWSRRKYQSSLRNCRTSRWKSAFAPSPATMWPAWRLSLAAAGTRWPRAAR